MLLWLPVAMATGDVIECVVNYHQNVRTSFPYQNIYTLPTSHVLIFLYEFISICGWSVSIQSKINFCNDFIPYKFPLTCPFLRTGGGRKCFPKFKFSEKFPIGLHVILQIQIQKFKIAYYFMCKIILTKNPSRCNLAPLLKSF